MSELTFFLQPKKLGWATNFEKDSAPNCAILRLKPYHSERATQSSLYTMQS